MKTENHPQTIGETIKSAFKLAADAAALRDAIATILPTAVSRDHAVLHRIYCTLTDFTIGFNTLSDRIAEIRAINRYLG